MRHVHVHDNGDDEAMSGNDHATRKGESLALGEVGLILLALCLTGAGGRRGARRTHAFDI
jgi:hypothetical protein